MISVSARYKIICELLFEADNTKVTLDVATRKIDGGYEVKDSLITEFWQAIADMAHFNGMSEVDILKYLHDTRLNASEQEEFSELLNPEIE